MKKITISKDRQIERTYEIHKACCKHCPSNNNRKNGTEDEESKDLKETCSKEFIAKEVLFPCAWRPNKLCKGICDYMNIDQQYINSIISPPQNEMIQAIKLIWRYIFGAEKEEITSEELKLKGGRPK